MFLNKISFVIVSVSWIVFVAGFLFYFKLPSKNEKLRNSFAMLGFVFEAVAFAIIFLVRRDLLSDFFPVNLLVRLIITVSITCLAIASTYLSIAAFSSLGKQWSPFARIIENHKLIVTGAYRFVRHPIYSGTFGLMIVTGYVISKPWAVITAAILYFFGTIFRIKIEEKLLLEYFGKQYEDYKSRVSALIPYIF